LTLLTTNKWLLSGTVCKAPIQKVSPSGIPHCQFLLEHRSQQKEAGLYRQTWCRIPVVASGHELKKHTQNIRFGTQLTIEGFVSCHQIRDKLVLHAEKIKFINFGE